MNRELNKTIKFYKVLATEEDYGKYPEDDEFLENSFDANINFETEQVVKDLVKAGQLFVSAEDVVLSISLKVEGDEECK